MIEEPATAGEAIKLPFSSFREKTLGSSLDASNTVTSPCLLLKKEPGIRKKVASGGATKEQVIAWMKKKFLGRTKPAAKGKNKDGVANFYAVVIGRLKTKDIELGEFTFDVDHVSSMYGNRWVKDEIVGKTIKVTGVSGPFVDKLLQIKRGQMLKVRSGKYLAAAKTLTFGGEIPCSRANYGVQAFRLWRASQRIPWIQRRTHRKDCRSRGVRSSAQRQPIQTVKRQQSG